jgi:hypothetical protein
MDKDWGKVFVLDLRHKEEIKEGYPLPNNFLGSISHYYIIDKGIEDIRKNLINAIADICVRNNNSTITLHILGHGVVPKGTKESVGIEFLTWDEFASVMVRAKENNTVFINMLSVCYSNGFMPYDNCYDKIWYTTTEAESIEIPAEIYWDNYFNDFESYLKKNDGTGYFGFSIK